MAVSLLVVIKCSQGVTSQVLTFTSDSSAIKAAGNLEKKGYEVTFIHYS